MDDVMRLLWTEYGRTGRGLEEDAFERAVARVADVGDFFARYVEGTDPLPYADVLGAAGVAFSATQREPARAFLGARLKVVEGLLIADAVIRGAAAMEAGVLPNDELLALDGNRIANPAALENALRRLKLGETAALLVCRAGVTRTLTLTGRADPRPLIALRIEGASELRRAWLGKEE
jgi:predicted metalloprotease with PDZ domain